MSIKTIEFLKSRISQIELELSRSGNNDELINEKVSHLKIIKMIQFIEKNEIDITKKVVTLPSIEGHGYYSYRLMIDNEVDDPNQWTEIKEINGETAEFVIGDKIITS